MDGEEGVRCREEGRGFGRGMRGRERDEARGRAPWGTPAHEAT